MDDNFKPVRYETVRDNGLPYGRTPSSPSSISITEIDKWKSKVSPTFKHYIQTQYDELVESYNQLMRQYEVNKMVYESNMSFEPIIGQTYYLYTRLDGSRFLSLVAPEHTFWSGYVGSFRLNSQYAWEEI